MDGAVLKIARCVREAGGRAFLVGGCVRDALLGIQGGDFDMEVFGVAPEALTGALSRDFRLDLVGLSFGVVKIHGHAIDVSLPRRESKRGIGHKGFFIDSDPSLTVDEAASRRDFTVNAIYQDPLTGEHLDPYGGRSDLRRRILRHVSGKFAEDPLRVLRGMQFIARFGLEPDPETVRICRSMTIEDLPPERLFGEWKKLLLQGVRISRGLAFLRDTGWVRYFPELDRLIGCRQAPEWHPEGDVWNHTCFCLDAYAADRDERRKKLSGDELSRQDHEDLIVALAVLCHDFGKPLCSRYDPEKKRIRSLGHDEAGAEPTLSFLRRLTNEERILKEVPPLVRNHMAPYAMWKSKSGAAAIRRLALRVGSVERLLRVCAADDRGRPPIQSDGSDLKWLAEQAELLRVMESAPKPIAQGRDLIALGLEPSPRFGEILKRCFEAQLDGAFSDRAGALAYLKDLV